MPHKIMILIRADIGLESIQLHASGCLTVANQMLLRRHIDKARELDPSAPIEVDLTAVGHIEPEALRSLRSSIVSEDAGGAHVADPVRFRIPPMPQQCPGPVEPDGRDEAARSPTSADGDHGRPVPRPQVTSRPPTSVLRAFHTALFPGALLRCSDADLAGSGPIDALIVFRDGTTATATYRDQDRGPQLTVDPHQNAAGDRHDGMTWSLHHAAPSVLRIHRSEEHPPWS